MISFRIDFVPPKTTAQQKRLVIRDGRPIFFKGKKGETAENDYMSMLAPHVPAKPLMGPTIMQVQVVWPYLKSDINTKAKAARSDAIPHTGKPDLDNWLKQFTDVLCKLRFIENDAQITTILVTKQRCRNPGISLTLQEETCASIAAIRV